LALWIPRHGYRYQGTKKKNDDEKERDRAFEEEVTFKKE